MCNRNDPNLDNCIKESIQTFLPSLRKKSDKFDFPPIDPFAYETVTFNYRNSNLMTGSFTVKDVKTYGMSRGKVLKVKSDFSNDEMMIQAELLFPKLFSTGFYTSNMTVSAFQLNSKGQYNVTMKNVRVKWNIKGKLENVDGEGYMKVYKFDASPEAEDMKISVSGLFQDENLSMLEFSFAKLSLIPIFIISDKIVNEFFNQSWRTLYKEMIPETRKQWEPILLGFADKFFSQFPFRRLLLQD